jgi:hypothetical protein
VTGIFKEKNPAAIVLLFLLGLAFRLKFFLHPATVEASNAYTGLLSVWLQKFLPTNTNGNVVLSLLLGYGLSFLQALRINVISNNLKLFAKPNFLPGYCYLLFCSFSQAWCLLSPALVINSCLIFLFSQLTKFYNANNPKILIYNAGLVLGLAGLLYHNSNVFVLWFLLALVLMRPFELSEWVVALMGFFTPLYFLLIGLYLMDGQTSVKEYFLHINLAVKLPVIKAYTYIGFLSVFILSIIGLFFLQGNLRRLLIHVRKSWSLLLAALVCALLLTIFALFQPNTGAIIMLFVACIAANYFFYSKTRWMTNAISWLLVAYTIGSFFVK